MKTENKMAKKIMDDLNKSSNEPQREYVIYASRKLINSFHNAVIEKINRTNDKNINSP